MYKIKEKMTKRRLKLRNMATIIAWFGICMMLAGCDKENNNKSELKGTVEIIGNVALGEILTARWSLQIIDGNRVNCQWKRCNNPSDAGTNIGADYSYTVTEADIGKYIKVIVSHPDYSGSVTSETVLVYRITKQFAYELLIDGVKGGIESMHDAIKEIGNGTIYGDISGTATISNYKYINGGVSGYYISTDYTYDVSFNNFSTYFDFYAQGYSNLKILSGKYSIESSWYESFNDPLADRVSSTIELNSTEFMISYNSEIYTGVMSYYLSRHETALDKDVTQRMTVTFKDGTTYTWQ